MTPILFADITYRADKIYSALKAPLAAGGYHLQMWPAEVVDMGAIKYAIIWYPPDESLQNLPNLAAIFSIAAGVDGVADNSNIPAHVPLIRTVDPFLTQGMVEYALLHGLRYHRHQPFYDARQREGMWDRLPQIAPQERTIGIMGLGEIGSAIAAAFTALHFQVRGWSRTAKALFDVECFHGTAQLPQFLSKCEIVINVLPLTPETRGILKADLFNLLPMGAYLINMGRGGHMVLPDILAALASGQLAHATLDAFENEPLTPEDPLWQHPKITVTPHIASITRLDRVAANVMAQINAHQAGQPWQHTVDRQKGY